MTKERTLNPIEQVFGEDRLASVYLSKVGQVGLLYADQMVFSAEPELAAEALRLISELFDRSRAIGQSHFPQGS